MRMHAKKPAKVTIPVKQIVTLDEEVQNPKILVGNVEISTSSPLCEKKPTEKLTAPLEENDEDAKEEEKVKQTLATDIVIEMINCISVLLRKLKRRKWKSLV